MILRLEETESTNSYAKEHIDTLNDKTVVHALHQTNGRGRLNRSWVDLGDENLFISIVLKPSQAYKNNFPNITQYAGVVLCNVLEKYGTNPKIKWPNDIMLDGERKISGILSESVIENGNISGIVLGIGVNLNANRKDVDSIPDRVATSLNLEINKDVNMQAFLEEFITEFFKNYDEFLIKGFEYIKKEYIRRNCFINKDLKIQILNNIKTGFAKGVNSNGELLLQTDDNKELVLNMGDILWVI